MKGLLVVERMVLESIAKKRKTVSIISKDTKLTEMFVRTIISNLKDYGLITYKKGQFTLSGRTTGLCTVNESQNIKHEVKDLFSSLVDNHYCTEESGQMLKMQKIWLTDLEYKILMSMMTNMENYIKSIRKDRLLNPEEEVLAEQRILFWGADTYSNLINRTLKVA